MSEQSKAPPKLVGLVSRSKTAIERALAAFAGTDEAGLGRPVVVVLQKARRGDVYGAEGAAAETDEAVVRIVAEPLLAAFAETLPRHAQEAAAWLSLEESDAAGCLAVSPSEAAVGEPLRAFGVTLDIPARSGFAGLGPEVEQALRGSLPALRAGALRFAGREGLPPGQVAAIVQLTPLPAGVQVTRGYARREVLAGAVVDARVAALLRSPPPDGHSACLIEVGHAVVVRTFDVTGDLLAAPPSGQA
jgi:hypothetical protein